jgi:hypothetical protein
MSGISWIVPYGADQTAYLVVDRLGRLGSGGREIEIERTDLETIIADLIAGQFNDPVRVVDFNTLEYWSRDVSRDIALEIQSRHDIEGAAVPEHILDFVTCHAAPARQRPGPGDIAALQREAMHWENLCQGRSGTLLAEKFRT